MHIMHCFFKLTCVSIVVCWWIILWVGDRTHNQMVKRPKYLPLIPHLNFYEVEGTILKKNISTFSFLSWYLLAFPLFYIIFLIPPIFRKKIRCHACEVICGYLPTTNENKLHLCEVKVSCTQANLFIWFIFIGYWIISLNYHRIV
jgi:hypothetical protein